MKKKKMWVYLSLFLVTGLVYLGCVDRWQVYAEPLRRVKSWYDGLGVEEWLLAVDGSAQATGQPSFLTNGDLEGGETSNDEKKQEEGASGEGQGDAFQDGTNASSGDVQTAGEVVGEGSSEGEGSSDDGEAGEEEPEPDGPVYMTVEDDYFSDALFIGDSRTVGLFEYGGLEEIATFYASKGLTIYELFDAQLVSVPGEKKKLTVEEGLQQNRFAKIYLMIGINEMGGLTDIFLQRYQETIDRLLEMQPDAILYIQAIIRVSTERSEQGDYITNEGIQERNDAIAQMADNERVFFLDVNPLVCDETGGMEPSYTTDGVHLKAKYIEIWKDFLKTHAICLED